jgi:transposase
MKLLEIMLFGFETFDSTSYNDWVNQFKSKLQSSVDQWINLAGAKAGQLLRSLRDKASQWWYFFEIIEWNHR